MLHYRARDLKVVSFRGLGRGKGFAKDEEYSILDDGDISLIVARRTLQLCHMFLEADVLKMEEVMKILNIRTQQRVMMIPGNVVYSDSHDKDLEIDSLKKKITEMEEESDLESQVELLLRVGAEIGGGECLGLDANGLFLKIRPTSQDLNLFLFEMVKRIPFKLRRRLLLRVKPDELLYLAEVLKNIPRNRTLAEKLIGEPSHDYPMSMKEFNDTVLWVKKLLRDPVKKSKHLDKLLVEIQKLMDKYEAEINKKGNPKKK
jgi:hypothetical protein